MRQPNHDIDVKKWRDTKPVGDKGELIAHRLLNHGIETIEVKNDQRARQTGNVFIETQCQNLNTGEWYPSGINSTKAAAWLYILNEKPIVAILMQTTLLREIASRYPERHAAATHPPAKGVVIPAAALVTTGLKLGGTK
jgi:hypothetical protein